MNIRKLYLPWLSDMTVYKVTGRGQFEYQARSCVIDRVIHYSVIVLLLKAA